MSGFRLAIFDLDGTLVDTLIDLCDAVNFTLQRLGRPGVPLHGVRDMVGEGVVRLLERALGEQGARAGEALPIFRARYAAHLVDRTRPYPGISEMLAAAPQVKAIVTNKPGAMARRIVDALGLAAHFVSVLGDDDVERKPSPAAVERLLGECGVAANRALLIGDGRVDIHTARAAGVRCCAVTWGYVARDALLAERPEFVADSVTELTALLGDPSS
jgi:phosphoglycolate phosphatase